MILPILDVTDVDASVAFYTQKLGFEHAFSMPGEDGKSSYAMVNLGSATIGLNLNPATTHRGSGVATMIYVPETTGLDPFYSEIQSKGVAIEEEIADQYWGDRTFSLRDPDNYWLTFCKTVKEVSPEEIIAAQRDA